MKVAVILLAVLAAAYGRSSRIVNGETSDIEKHPHQISIQVKRYGSWSTHICGGSIIGPNTALTAAHCVDVRNGEYRIRIGSSEINKGDTYVVDQVILADGYTGKADGSLGTFQQDMAILKFSNANFPQENIIDLASGTDGDFVGDKVTISGWGKTEDGGLSNILQEKQVTIMSESECQKGVDALGGEIYGGHICFQHNTGGSCSGDSGGPMVHENNGKKILIGVTSWGVSNCDINHAYPSVYARVTYFRDWIRQNAGI